jgi:hypothetical protein
MATLSDGALALQLLKDALAFGKTDPDIDENQVTRLLTQAAVVVEVGPSPVYTSDSLNAAAAQGWRQKAALASGEYDDLGGGRGKYLRRPVGLAERWRGFAGDYLTGRADVLGGIPAGNGPSSGSARMISSLAAEFPL